MPPEIVPGGVFPDYELPDHTKAMRRLSELQGDDPLILTLARGHYCPKEHQQHLQLAAFYPQIGVAYHPGRHDRDRRPPHDPEIPGVGRRPVALSLQSGAHGPAGPRNPGIHRSGHDPMIPHTLVLRPRLVIHSVYNGYWFWGRPSVEDLRQDLRAVTREIRPDWDLSTPGLREAWESGDRSPFHGWNRWSPERFAAERARATS